MNFLKELRKIACLSQQEVADKGGISVITYRRIENEKQKPRPVNKRGIAKVFNVRPGDIEWERDHSLDFLIQS